MKITVGDKEFYSVLYDNPTTRDFIELLPLTLTLEDYVATEKISSLPKRLSTTDAPKGSSGLIGDICYYSPWGNLGVFYKDFGYAGGLIKLGKIEQNGIDAFRVHGRVEVLLELV